MSQPHAQCHSILVVEDSQDLREGLRDLLQVEGFDVLTAENGAVALELLAATDQPCLVLLDLMMPVMDGWAFLQAVRERPGTKVAALPVVVVSAVAGQEAAEALRSRYACQLIKKPFDPEVVVRLARENCDCGHGAS